VRQKVVIYQIFDSIPTGKFLAKKIVSAQNSNSAPKFPKKSFFLQPEFGISGEKFWT